MPEISITTIGSRVSKWGEGPIWWKDHLIYVDIEDHKIVKLYPETEEEQYWDVGERVGTVVPINSGGYLYAGDRGITSFDPSTNDKIVRADPEAEKRPDNRFNDGKCDVAGRFWAGTISTVKKQGDAALYMFGADGGLRTKLTDLTNSNGICWNAKATKMYHIDTPTKQIRSYDFDVISGDISNSQVAVDTAALGYSSSPDGMTIDENDNLWVAFCHGACVVCFDTETGKQLQMIDLPCVETTACAFGGENLDRLFVTTGIHKTIQEADAGKILVIDNLGVKGVPAYAYKS
ncbi:MAG: SMP-30/gluconolactonase/LRE family protein [Verrucomicrobiota bacterium]